MTTVTIRDFRTSEEKTIEVKVGDYICFKSDIEQSGKIVGFIRSAYGMSIRLENEFGFQGHYEFLTSTLIPDLRESGSDATADDFEDCVEIIRHLQGKEAPNFDKPIFW